MNSQTNAYALIKERILDLSLQPGERVRAHDVAAELGTSRTPVREALSRLEQEGLVIRDSGWGYLVSTMTFSEVISLFKVREVLEVEAALEAIEHRTPDLISKLSRLLDNSERNLRSRRLSDFQKANREFHATLERSAHNVFLEGMLSNISDRIRILGAMVLARHGVRGEEIIEENRTILAAFKDGDAKKLETAVRMHVQSAGAHVLRCLQGDFYCLPVKAVA